MRIREDLQSVDVLPVPEQVLSAQDPALALIIASQTDRWPTVPSEDPIWGLLRIVIAQQISTVLADKMAERLISAHPFLTKPSSAEALELASLRSIGLIESRARCCVKIIERSDEIRTSVLRGETWEEALAGIKGIGPWTIRVFRIMVLRDPDVLPLGDIGLRPT